MSAPVAPPVSRRALFRRIRRSPVTHVVAALLMLALLQLFLVKPFQVPSESMSPTLETGDRILVNRLSVTTGDPAAGDVVVFSRPDSWTSDAAPPSTLRTVVGWVGDLVGFGPSNLDALVKRVIGQPGTTVRCCAVDGRVEVDGAAIDESYVRNDLPYVVGQVDCGSMPASSRCFGPVTVPDDSYFVLGDNRANSSDSVAGCRGASADAACPRFVPRAAMIGKVFAVAWPLDRAFLPLDGG